MFPWAGRGAEAEDAVLDPTDHIVEIMRLSHGLIDGERPPSKKQYRDGQDKVLRAFTSAPIVKIRIYR